MARQKSNVGSSQRSRKLVVNIPIGITISAGAIAAIVLAVPRRQEAPVAKPPAERVALGIYRGQVVDTKGVPWRGLLVEPDSLVVRNATTESSGRFTLEGPEGREIEYSIVYEQSSEPYRRRVKLVGAMDRAERIVLPRRPPTPSQAAGNNRSPEQEPSAALAVPVVSPVAIQSIPSEPTLIKGRVIEAPNGGPIADAVVSILGVLRPGARTNQNGWFELDPGKGSRCTLTVKKDGYVTARTDVSNISEEQLIKLRR